jgi:subtilisin family serine protease
MRVPPTCFCYLCLCTVLSIVAILAGASSAAAQGSPTLRSKAADAETLVAKAARPEGVRIIVTLRGATTGPDTLPLPSASADAPAALSYAGPLRDGQSATVEQSRILATHLGSDDARRQRWSPRFIPDTPYMAMTVDLAELEALAADTDVVSIHEDGEGQPGLQDTIPLIGMPAAVNLGATGAGQSVAILDTGVEYNHVFVTPRVTRATCFSTADTGPTPTFATLCPNGANFMAGGTAGINCTVAGCAHGTHVAGIAAGNQATGTPQTGVARDSDIFAIQIYRRRIANNQLISSDADILAALNDLHGRIAGGEASDVVAVNLSNWDSATQVTGRHCDTLPRAAPFKTVIDQLRARGVATVIISGNGSQTDQSAFPGCISSAITVSATTKNDLISNFANMSDAVDLLAPGENITSSVNPTPNFGVMSGTSMAAPHVTGAIAAIHSACPTIPAPIVDRIEDELITTGRAITDHRAGGRHTRTRIRVDLAVQNLRALFPNGCTPTPVATLAARASGIIEASKLLLLN